MDEKKFVTFKKEELGVKEYIKNSLGKGKISQVSIEYTPVGEKIIVATQKPGLVIGRRGEKINEMTRVLKRRFNLDNPHIEIEEVTKPMLDAQLVADDIAIGLERRGSLKFKIIAYRALRGIMDSGALGAEIVLSGKLPSDRAKTWRFTEGYLKKTGDPAKVVKKAIAQATTMSGVVGIKVSILGPDAEIHDKVDVNEELMEKLRHNAMPVEEEVKKMEKKEEKVSEKAVKKTVKKKTESVEETEDGGA